MYICVDVYPQERVDEMEREFGEEKGRDVMLAAALQHWTTRLQSQVLTFRIQYIRCTDFMVYHACTHCLFLAVLLDEF